MTIKIKFDMNIVKFISMFETITHASVKDCINNENRIIFIVNTGEMSKAIGKRGVNIRNLEKRFNKKIKIIEYNDDLLLFVQKVIAPLKVADIVSDEKRIIITPPDSKTRELLIGRGGMNLRASENIVKRYFNIDEIRVI